MKKSKIKIWHILVCVVIAAVLYLALYYSQVKALENYEKGVVVIAKTDIPENVEIDELNSSTYFTTMMIETGKIPKSAYINVSELNGSYTVGNIDAGAIITKSMVSSLKSITNEYKDAKMVTISTNGLEQSVAGTLRIGDIIDIYSIEEKDLDGDGKAEVEAVLLKGGVTISRSYDASGVAISKDDTVSIAQIIMIPMDEKEVAEFLAGLENGTIKLIKHIN